LNIQLKTTDGQIKDYEIRKDFTESLGVLADDYTCRSCINNCIFCFIDQMVPNIRKTLYVKDDDLAFSFYFGNYITLTNFGKDDYERVSEQNLNPLYVSVHTTNKVLHKKMMRYKQDFDIIESLKKLSKNGICFHTQIVLVPDWNDGDELERTLSDLTSRELRTKSIGIVPVGLTKFRDNLVPIRTLSKEDAESALEIADRYRKKFKWIYCSDELFLLAEKEIPPARYYHGYLQLDIGIGLIRKTIASWNYFKNKFKRFLKKNKVSPVFVTAELAYPLIKKISDEISLNWAINSRVIMVKNNFFGDTVTVAGLIAAKDIFEQVEILPDEHVVLSMNLFNTEGFTIDNMFIDKIIEHFNKKVLFVEADFTNWYICE